MIAMRIINAGSGSKGNCTIVSSGNTHIMIDCGIGITKIRRLVQDHGIDHLDGLVLTHRHSDHTRYLSYFMDTTIYTMDPDLPHQVLIESMNDYELHGLTMIPFRLSHDAPYTFGIKLMDQRESIMIITDTGYVPKNVLKLGYDATYLMVECNHDIQMLLDTNRPYPLKARILGDEGHLNNEDGAKAIASMVGPHTTTIMAAHISQQANDPQLVMDTLTTVLKPLDRDDLTIVTLDQNQCYCKGEL